MKASMTSAALSAALFSQAALAATIGHSHGHMHRRVAAPHPALKEKRTTAVNFMSTTDVSYLQSKNILIGANEACATEATNAVTVGSTGGPFVVEFTNNHDEDIVLVVWSGKTAGQWGAIDATFIGAQQPDVTHTLQSNTSTWVSFDPAKAPGGTAVSGGWGAVYPGKGLSAVSGQLDNTIGEYTFSTANSFSTTDVSRLIQMKGNSMEIENYLNKADADDDSTNPACASTMDKCAFVCDDKSVLSCMFGALVDCVAGAAGNTADASGQDGGCAGMSASGGYMKVSFGS
ncbi:hypothetical protein K461DRAFT_282682 [Myriangium duriaei CBS 260.36]|uniref:Uncharacterized protein n=1 Tax=Myriangium duriaei CBS 260.36 TaxID=1168546 RepID=A0A9P4IT76_9PEZI|nr:hypothetical protein K461DRAFT_282682 [Myriangium duriaei CBS 260.36]